jgi:hypothetical protein
LAARTWRNEKSFGLAVTYAWFNLISFWPQMIGQVRYLAGCRHATDVSSTERSRLSRFSVRKIRARDKNAESISG